MGVPTARTDLSAVAASNSPAGADTIAAGTGPDDYLRAHAGLIRANYDDILLKAPIASPTFTGTVTIPSPFKLDATSVTATAAQLNSLATITSGTYTPTVTVGTNATGTSASVALYQRIANIITVSGYVYMTTTAAARTMLYLTLPVASALTSDDLYGSGTAFDSELETYVPVVMTSYGTGDKAQMDFKAANVGGAPTVFYTFMYQVK
jgi:hypothetical protein